LLKSIKECFANFSFVMFLTISFTVIYVQTALMQGVLYYFDELKVPAIPLYVALLAGIVGGLVMWIKQRDVWGVKRSMRMLCLLFGTGCLVLLLFGRDVAPATVGFLLVGIGFSGAMYLVPLMNGDVIDADEHRTGLRREGMYAGVNSFVTKPAISIAQAVFLNVITWFGYDQSLAKGAQSISAQTGIMVGWLAVPTLLFFACLALLHWYPLAGTAWEQIKRDLAAAHEQKEQRYLAEHLE
jgi:GPH family glycoside/pentoside/hexuronide:cation symporter